MKLLELLCPRALCSLMQTPVAQAQSRMLLSREPDCVSLQGLVKIERLLRALTAPKQFAAMTLEGAL